MLRAVDPRRGVVGDLLGTLEGKDAQLVLSYIVWPARHPIRNEPSAEDPLARRARFRVRF